MSTQIYSMDCVEGARKHLETDSVDLMVCDPPYGIDGDQSHKHYNRKEEFVIDGNVEVPSDRYLEFSKSWITEA